MLRETAFELWPPVPQGGRHPARTTSECDEGDSGNFESSETDAAGEQPSFERPAYSSFTSQQVDSGRGDLNPWGQEDILMLSGGSVFGKTTCTLSDDSDDERKTRKASAPPRQQHQQQSPKTLNEGNSMQDLMGILLAPSTGANQMSTRPSTADNVANGAHRDASGNPANQEQSQTNDDSLLQNMDSNNLPDLPSLLQTLGSRSHPYGIGLVPPEVIRAQLVLYALDAQTAPASTGEHGAATTDQSPWPEVVMTATTGQIAYGCSVALTGHHYQQLLQQQQVAASQLLQEFNDGLPSRSPTLSPSAGRDSPAQLWLESVQQAEQQQLQQQGARPLDSSGHLLVLPLVGTERMCPVPPLLTQSQKQQGLHLEMQDNDNFGGTDLPPTLRQSFPPASPGPSIAGVGVDSHIAMPLETDPSFTGNNDELIAAMAAAGLGPSPPRAAAPTSTTDATPAATTSGFPCPYASIAATAAEAKLLAPAGVIGFESLATVDADAVAMAASARPGDPGSRALVAAGVGGAEQLKMHPQPPSSGATGPRPRRYVVHGSRGSSSGMAELPDEAALAAIAGVVASITGSVCGSAPGTPPVSPHGTVTRPSQPWSASSSARSLQSYNMSPAQPTGSQPPAQDQQLQRQPMQQPSQQEVPNPRPTPPSYAPSPSPDPRFSSHLQQQATTSVGEGMEYGGPAASATPAISVADGIAAMSPSDTAPPPAHVSVTNPSPSPFAGAGANRGASPPTLAANVTSSGGGGGENPYRTDTQTVAVAAAGNNNHVIKHPLISLRSRDTASGGAIVECSSRGAHLSLGGCNLAPNPSLSCGYSASVAEGSISGCGLSALTLNSTGAGSLGGAVSGGGGIATPHKRSRAPPATTSCVPAVTSGGGSVIADEDCGGSSGGEGDEGGNTTTTTGEGKTWNAEDLPAPVAVNVTGLSREVGDDGRRRRITVHGVFHADRYLSNQDCILYENKFISRSAFEKAGGSTTAKWHCSIKVAGTQSLTLANWLNSKGLPVLKGGSRKSKRQRAVEKSGGSVSTAPQQLPLTSQPLHEQHQPQARLSAGSFLPVTLQSTRHGAITSPRNSGGSVSVDISNTCGPSGVSLDAWSQSQQLQRQQQHPPSPAAPPLQSSRQHLSPSHRALPYLNPHPSTQAQQQTQSHRLQQHSQNLTQQGLAAFRSGDPNAQRLPTCPTVIIPPSPLQPPQQQSTPSPTGGGDVPLPPMSSTQHSGQQLYPPSVFQLAQLSPAASLGVVATTPAGGSGSVAGGPGRTMSGAIPEGRPFSCPVGMVRSESTYSSFGPAPMSAPVLSGHAHLHYLPPPPSFLLGGGGNGSTSSGVGALGSDRSLYGNTNSAAGLYSYGHPRRSSGTGACALDTSGSGVGHAGRTGSLPPLFPLSPQGR